MNCLRVEGVFLHAPNVGRIPAPWNFTVEDLDEHFPEVQDQLMAMIWGYADRVDFDDPPG